MNKKVVMGSIGIAILLLFVSYNSIVGAQVIKLVNEKESTGFINRLSELKFSPEKTENQYIYNLIKYVQPYPSLTEIILLILFYIFYFIDEIWPLIYSSLFNN